MNDLPLVSVLVPCYNHARYVEKTIESLMAQTYRNVEVLILDDGSRDDSVELIRGCEKKWGRSFLVGVQENQGVSRTLNKLLGMAKGKYVCLLASDDWILPWKLESQVEYMEKHPEAGMVYSDAFIHMETTGETLHERYRDEYPSGWIFNQLLDGNFITGCTNMIRRACFEELGFFDENSAIEDWDMWLRTAKKYEIHYIDKPTAVYRVHGQNTSVVMSHEMLESMKAILLKHCPDKKSLGEHLLKLSFRELKTYSGTDSRLALAKFKELALYCYKPTYLRAVLRFILFRVKSLSGR